MFIFHLDNEDPILGSVSGRVQRNLSLVRIRRGSRVKIEVRRYASTIKRIEFIDSATRIRKVGCFFQLQYSPHGARI